MAGAVKSIRLTDEQTATLSEAAEAAGVSLSAYIVEAAMLRAAGDLADGPVTPAQWRAIARRVAQSL